MRTKFRAIHLHNVKRKSLLYISNWNKTCSKSMQIKTETYLFILFHSFLVDLILFSMFFSADSIPTINSFRYLDNLIAEFFYTFHIKYLVELFHTSWSTCIHWVRCPKLNNKMISKCRDTYHVAVKFSSFTAAKAKGSFL